MSLFIGLMSGTSADGMDAALVRIDEQGQCEFIGAHAIRYPTEFRHLLRQAALSPTLEPELIMTLDRTIAEFSVQAIQALLAQQKISGSNIQAIGSHGHTLRHKPAPQGFSWQIGDPNWIAEHTGIDCVADFRRRDIAAGGEGAPLVPAFHAASFQAPCMVLNIGGLANLTVLDAAAEHHLGFDTGPGNALIDEWCQRHLQCNFDDSGGLARSGTLHPELLDDWLSMEYFQQPPPKSTGRELFQLDRLLHTSRLTDYAPRDVLRTLTEFSAHSIRHAVLRFGHEKGPLYICGGGVHNTFLLERLQKLLPNHQVQSSLNVGLHPDWMEAMAFAWLAWCFVNRTSGNVPGATGAQGERVLGGFYPAFLTSSDRK